MQKDISQKKDETVDTDQVFDMIARLQKIFDTIEMKIDVIHKDTQKVSDKEQIKQALENIHDIQE